VRAHDGKDDTTVADKPRRPHEGLESQLLVRGSFQLATSLGIHKLLVQADEFRDIRLVDKLRGPEQVVWITRGHSADLSGPDPSRDIVLRIPDAALSRMSQLNVALFLAVLNGHVELDETVLCLSGVAGSQRLDMLFVTNPKRDFPWFQKGDIGLVASREFAAIVEIALRLAAEGREGRPIGTIFVLGDPDILEPYLRQLILNPCKGHPRRARSIHNPASFETIRELAALDGAFIVSKKGVVESAGTYLDAPVRRTTLPSGLGARHAAALAITEATDAIAVVVSSSSGTVTVFHEGTAILELEKPQPLPRSRAPSA
jgi:diadenylate cyclase